MKSYYYLGAIAAYIISFLICFNVGSKLDIEKFISDKTIRRVGLVLIAFLFSIFGSLIIDGLNITKEYQILIDSFFVAGPATSIFVWALPVKLNRDRHD
jgi:Na+-transporting methylmalonyl-CoA/oxaloacetate decarboxylase beta subunit